MHEIEYFFYLSAELIDRLRVYAQKEKGEIKDIINANGDVIKQPLFFETYNLAFTFATLDLKANWRHYRDNLEKKIMK